MYFVCLHRLHFCDTYEITFNHNLDLACNSLEHLATNILSRKKHRTNQMPIITNLPPFYDSTYLHVQL